MVGHRPGAGVTIQKNVLPEFVAGAQRKTWTRPAARETTIRNGDHRARHPVERREAAMRTKTSPAAGRVVGRTSPQEDAVVLATMTTSGHPEAGPAGMTMTTGINDSFVGGGGSSGGAGASSSWSSDSSSSYSSNSDSGSSSSSDSGGGGGGD